MRIHTVYLTYSFLSLGSAFAVAVSMGVWMDALPSPWFAILGLVAAFLSGLGVGCHMAYTSHFDAQRQRQIEDASRENVTSEIGRLRGIVAVLVDRMDGKGQFREGEKHD